jgi:hypothetical protein
MDETGVEASGRERWRRLTMRMERKTRLKVRMEMKIARMRMKAVTMVTMLADINVLLDG